MSDEMIDRRDYGRLEAQVEQLVKDVHEMQATIKAMNETLQEAKGGWKLLMAVSGASATAAGLISWVLTHVSLK